MGRKRLAQYLLGAVTVLMIVGCQSRTDWSSTAPRTTLAAPGGSIAGGISAAALGAIAEPTGAMGEPLSILSFNMQHRNRPRELDAVAERLRADLRRLPDFILCQEVVFRRHDRADRYDTATSLADRLGYHSRGTKRTSDREGVAIISRYPFAFYDALHLDARTNGLLLGFRRVSAMGEFLVPGVGRVRVVDVHLAHWPFEGHVRRKQLSETLAWIARRDAEVRADVTILGGDFNAKPHHDELAPLRSFAATGGLTYHDWNDADLPTKGSPGSPVKRIDYIFVAAPARDVRLATEEALFSDGLQRPNGSRFWPSDHVPLLHEYTVADVALTGVD